MNYQDLQQLLNKIDSFEEREKEWENLKKKLYELEFNAEQQITYLNRKLSEEDNITKKAQEQVFHYHQILEYIPHIIFEADSFGHPEFISKKLFDYTGLKIGEFVKRWKEFFDPEEINSLILTWKTSIRQGESFRCEHRFKGKDGVFRWFKTEVTPIKNDLNEVTKWIATSTDVDAEKKTLAQLHESEQQFRFMAEMIPQIVWTTLPNGYEDFHNIRFTEYSGIEATEANGDALKSIIHPSDLERTTLAWNRALNTGEAYEIEYRFKKKDGSYRWFLGRALPLKDTNGNIIKWFGTSTDINDEKETNIKITNTLEELKSTNKELAHVNNILNNFVYMAAHDLRSPVSNLKTIFELLKQEEDAHRKDEYINVLDKCVLRLDNTVKSLVEVIDIENINRSIKEISLEETVKNLVDDLSTLYPDIHEFIVYNFEKCPTITFVEGYIISILKNLITNSVKYRSLRRKLKIIITSSKVKDQVLITIEDNGIGFNVEQHKETIFQPFKRLTHLGEGKGVGLFLVKNIVEKNGGKVEVESKENSGTKFSIYIKEYQINK